jgi:hypothetical protein
LNEAGIGNAAAELLWVFNSVGEALPFHRSNIENGCMGCKESFSGYGTAECSPGMLKFPKMDKV